MEEEVVDLNATEHPKDENEEIEPSKENDEEIEPSKENETSESTKPVAKPKEVDGEEEESSCEEMVMTEVEEAIKQKKKEPATGLLAQNANDAAEKEQQQKLELHRRNKLTKLAEDQILMKEYFQSDAAQVRKRITKSQILETRLNIMATSSLEMQNIISHHIKSVNQDRIIQCEEVKRMPVCTLEQESTFGSGIIALHQYLSNGERYKKIFNDQFKKTILKMNTLTTKLSKEKTILRAKSKHLKKELLIRRKACEVTWDQYWKSMQKTETGEIEEDPYLFGRLFDTRTQGYQKIQSTYTKEMTEMFDTILTIDNERMADQKAALLDYVLNVKEFYRQEIAQLDRVLDKVNLMNPDVDVREFVQKGQFFQPQYSNESNEAPSPIFQVPLQFVRNQDVLRSIHEDVERWGTIHRPGKIISSNWKPVHAIVTKYGYFHYFNDQKDESPTLTVKLEGAQIAMKNESLNVFEILVPNTNWLGFTGNTTYQFRCDSQDLMIDWIVTIKHYTTNNMGTN